MKTIQMRVVLGFAFSIVGGSLAPAQILVDADFNASSDSAALRANSAGQDWCESRQDVPTLLSLDRTPVGGNATAKAKFTASSTGNAYLTQEFSSPQRQTFSVQWDIYVDSILDLPDHPDRAGWMLIGDDTGTDPARIGPNAEDSERFVYMAFYKDGGGTTGTMDLVARESVYTTVATGLNLKQWYTIKVTLDLADDTYDVYVNGQHKATIAARTPKGSITHVSFAQWNDGAGAFYVDNVTASGGGCGSRCGLLPGDRVVLLTNNPRGATGLAAGTQGTVICDSDVKSGPPLFVSWDNWANGVNTDNFCECTPYPYTSNSGWWVYCEDVQANAQGNEIVVFDRTWRGGGIVGCENYIADLGQWAQSWVVGQEEEPMMALAGAPAGARVTGVSYLVSVVPSSDVYPDFRCSDYEIGLSSTAHGGTGNYALVWDNAGGTKDQNADDDVDNDYDIELSRTTNIFNGQSVNQTWYFRLKDTVSGVELKGTGCFRRLRLAIQYETLSWPSVTTQAATAVRCASATLNGRIVDDAGQACQYRFRYKKEGGSYTETAWTGSKRTGESFSQTITGLSSGTKYYFAAQVKSSTCESTWGAELSFTTGQLRVETQAATSIKCSSATLNGKVLDDGGQACQYRFRYRKQGGSYTETTWTGSKRTGESFSQTITGLSPGTTYYFAAQVKNSACESLWGSELTFTTGLRAETQAATDIKCTTATLNGRIADDGGEVCQYRFRYMKAGGSYSYTAYAGSKRTGETFSQAIVRLEQGAKYYFAAQVKNPTCESAWGSELTFTTMKPPTVTAEAATGITLTEATLNGRLTDDGGGTCQYRFRYGTGDGSYMETAWTGSIRGAGIAFSQAISGLSQGTKYYFAAQAKNEGCEGLWSTELTFSTLVVTKPKVVTLPAINLQDTTATFVGQITVDGNAPCQYRFRFREPPPLPLPGPRLPLPANAIAIQGESAADGPVVTPPDPNTTLPRYGYGYTAWTGAKRTGESFTHDINSLDPNTVYNVAAQARNSAGESDWSDAVAFKTTFTDLDKDGLRDQVESNLLNRFRPYFLFSKDYVGDEYTSEHYNPADICWYIARSQLLLCLEVGGIMYFDEHGTTAFGNDILMRDPANILLAAFEADDPYYASSDITKNPIHTNYTINPLQDWGDGGNPGRHGESWDVILQRRNVGLYGHVVRADTNYSRWMIQGLVPAAYKYVKIEYWQFFGYNNANQTLDVGDHEGDWETVQLLYDPGSDRIVSVFHYAHGEEMRFDIDSATPTTDPVIVPVLGVWFPTRVFVGPNAGQSFDQAGPSASNNMLYVCMDPDTGEFSHPVVYIEYGTHGFWPTMLGVWRESAAWGLIQGEAPNHLGLDWNHCYLTRDVPNLGEVGHPLAEVEGAAIVLHYNGFWGTYCQYNSPPPGPTLHTEWTYPANDPIRAAIGPYLEDGGSADD